MFLRADDRVRTGDLNLGKVPRYQLRYVRIYALRRSANLAHLLINCQSWPQLVSLAHGRLDLLLLDERAAGDRIARPD
jgi:hypothetical protein